MTRSIAALVLFGISFGYVEAAVVAYLRAIYDPLRQRLHPERPAGDLFPLITPRQLADAGPDNAQRLGIELGREAATLLMLAAAGLAASRNAQQWVAGSLVAFGVWDISFYAFLRLLIRWPASLFTWDILFLLPVPWVGPVIAPVLVSLSMIACGLVVLRRPVHLRWGHWAAILGGGLLIIIACCWDFRNTSAGGLPGAFNWPLFFAGEAVGVGGFIVAARYPSGGTRG
jgi:hypothetical protein